MPDPPDWTALEARVAREIPALDFLLGDWEGSGEAHGQPLVGRLHARRVLLGSAVQTREALYTADGALDYEDLALYRCDLDRGLFVQHLQPPGWSSEAAVEPIDGGVAWNAGPTEPRVELTRADDILTIAVWFPFQPVPASRMRYRKADP